MKSKNLLLLLLVGAVLYCSRTEASPAIEDVLRELIETVEGLRSDLRTCGVCSPSPPPTSLRPTQSSPAQPTTTQQRVPNPTTPWVPTHDPSTDLSSSPSTTTTASTTGTNTKPPQLTYRSCAGIPQGRYPQYVKTTDNEGVQVMCDTFTDGGNWTLIQRRMDGSVDFRQPWDAYERGFGHVDGEHWLGLSHVYHIMRNAQYELRVDMRLTSGQALYAQYRSFTLAHPSQQFILDVQGYSGNAGDFIHHGIGKLDLNGMKLSTQDRDNDLNPSVNCASDHGLGGWWYNNCAFSNLNGLWASPRPAGVYWGLMDDFVYVDMKIRPRG